MSPRPPGDGATWIGAVVVLLWVALGVVLLLEEPDPHSSAKAAEFQTLVGAHAPGASMDHVGERAVLPGMTRSAGPSDYTLLPGGFAVGGRGARDVFPYTEPQPLPPTSQRARAAR